MYASDNLERIARRAPRIGREQRGKRSAAGKRRTLAIKAARMAKAAQR